MLADLFKPAWKSSSAEKRLSAVSAMDSLHSENQNILDQLAAEDEDSSVRIAAIRKLSSAASTHEIASKDTDDGVREAAEKRTNELLATGNLDAGQFHALLERYPELTARIAAMAEIDAVRNETMPRLTSGQLLDVLALTTYTDTRQQAAEKLTAVETDIEVLESAKKILRGKDKNAERIIKDKIDEIREQQRLHAEQLATVARLIEEVEYLVKQDWRPEFKAKLLLHRSQWDKLDFDIETASLDRYQAARKIIDLRFDELQMIEQTRQSQQQLLDEVNSAVNEIAGGKLADILQSHGEASRKLEQYYRDWLQLAEKCKPDPALQTRFDDMLVAMKSANRLINRAAEILPVGADAPPGETGDVEQQLKTELLTQNIQLLGTALDELQWPASFVALQPAEALKAQLTDWRKAVEASAAEHKEKLDRLHKKISSIARFSRAGNLAGARQLSERVEKILEQFDGKERKGLEERFEEARKTLNEMCDWKNFASEPKYVELCEAMEALADSADHPDKRTTEMKDLQQKWKAIGYSDVSEKYWPRFKDAADRVYQPCAEFFDKRHKIRQTNLEQRQHHVERLSKLLEETDWDNSPDYKAVQGDLRDIINDFSAIKEVEYRDGQKQWKQFARLRDQVKARLAVAYDANIKIKHDLVAQVAALAEAPAREENLARLKSLQSRWKQVGITRRKQDQKAWVDFKKYGDTVFDKVQQLRQGQRAETDQQLEAYRNVINAIRKLASTADDLAEADHRFSELQASYEALPALPEDLPEKLLSAINRDYRNACDQFDQCHVRILRNRHQQQLEALRQKADLCAQLEVLGQSPAEQQIAEIAKQWDAIELHDPVLSRRIEKRRQSAGTVMDRSAIGDERRMLCIQLEIAADADSPAEDRERRMQYQLEQMNLTGLGQAAVNSAELIEKLELDWLCMPGAETALQQQLDERFHRVLRSAARVRD